MNKNKKKRYLLKKNNIIEVAQARIKDLENLLLKLEKEENGGDNKEWLRVRKIKSGFQYFKITIPGDTQGSYIRKKEIAVAQKIEQNNYNKRIREIASKEINQISSFLQVYKPDKIIQCYEKLHDGRKALIIPFEISDADYADRWQNIEFKSKEIVAGNTTSMTIKGEIVRSKSEALIADTLYSLGIPYHYEMPLMLNGCGLIHPDFTTLNRRTRQVFYLEHLGMVDERGYLRDALERVDCYENNGIYPGERLLLTYETDKRPLKRDELKKMLAHYLT